MGYHAFSLDPRTILGVGSDASLDEIHEAYRIKSKKHHPDVGGDEWAFRMVTRAYEVLKTTVAKSPAQPWAKRTADVGREGQPPDWGKIWTPSDGHASHDSTSQAEFNRTRGTGNTYHEEEDNDRPDTGSREAESPIPEPPELRTVDVELIWTRFETDRRGKLLSVQEGDDATLSVCMVISWPPHEFVDQAANFQSTSAILRALLDHMRTEKCVVASRSRMEDGRFVGWLSYPDVLMAQDAFLRLREAFRSRGLSVKLYTRDERVPLDWHTAAHQPVMSQAS
jgi:hypothetical protein